MEIIAPSVFMTIVVLAAILYLRNEIVFRIQMEQIGLVSQAAKDAIAQGKPWEHFYDDFNNGPEYFKCRIES